MIIGDIETVKLIFYVDHKVATPEDTRIQGSGEAIKKGGVHRSFERSFQLLLTRLICFSSPWVSLSGSVSKVMQLIIHNAVLIYSRKGVNK